jgi:hypothetical protein
MWPYRSLDNSLPRETWWDNWSHNFAVSMVVFPLLAGATVLVIAFVWGGL